MFKSPLSVLFITVFVDLLGFGIVLPLAPFYAEFYGATGFHVGLLMMVYSLMQFLFAPFWGMLSDRVGRRPIILLSLAGSSVSYLIFGLAPSLFVLFLSRIFAGIFGASISTAQAYIADTTKPEDRAKGMGLIGAAFGLGFILGPAVGGFFSQFGYGVPAFIASAICFTNLLIAFIRLPESLTPERRGIVPRGQRYHPKQFAKVFQNSNLGLVILLMFFATFSFANFEATFALFTERRFEFTSSEVGYLFAYVGLLVAIVQGGLVGRLAKMFGERVLVRVGMFLMVAGLGLIPYAQNLWILAIVLAFLAVGLGMNTPSLNSLITLYSDPTRHGGILGVSQSISSLARILGPAWGGFSFDRVGISSPYFTGGLVMLLAFLLSMLYLRKESLVEGIVEDPASPSG
ncbi:MAG TPA: MFS transporter [Nitrospiria bacterium]|jgi:DHA1 family tetracycline resistance protein-like MFS transporter